MSKDTGQKISARALKPDDWPMIERLFGSKGACGGCWCMYWRVERHGQEWERRKGAKNKRDFKKLVSSGEAGGCLAFADDEPVGWCCVGPRADFPKLNKTKGLQTSWDRRTWSITCFYIKSGWRGKGVAGMLLQEAVKVAKKGGAKMLEGYPVNTKPGQKMPAAFAWTGVAALFRRAKFKKLRLKDANRDVFQLKLKP